MPFTPSSIVAPRMFESFTLEASGASGARTDLEAVVYFSFLVPCQAVQGSSHLNWLFEVVDF